MQDYEKSQIKEAIQVACEHCGYGSNLQNPYALKQVLSTKLSSIRNSQYQSIDDPIMLMNVATSAVLIRCAISFLEKEYQV